MKRRYGFVSNSSSSSFVVAFPCEPQSLKDIYEILHDKESSDDPIEIAEAEQILKDIGGQKPNDIKIMTEAIEHGWFDGRPRDEDFKLPRDPKDGIVRTDWDAYNKAAHEKALCIVEDFMADNPTAFIYVFHYSDNDGTFFTHMEHDEVFWRVPYIQTSYH